MNSVAPTTPVTNINEKVDEPELDSTESIEDDDSLDFRNFPFLYHTVGALIAASLLGAASMPFNLWYLAFIAMATLFNVTNRATAFQTGRAFLLCFGTLLIACSAWRQATLVHFANHGVLESWGFLLLSCAWQAFPYALWGGLSTYTTKHFQVSRYLSLPFWFILIEGVSSSLFKTDIPFSFWDVLPMPSVAASGGPPIFYAVVVLGGLVMSDVYLHFREKAKWGKVQQRATVLLLAILGAWSLYLVFN